jgi:hypothetical protein
MLSTGNKRANLPELLGLAPWLQDYRERECGKLFFFSCTYFPMFSVHGNSQLRNRDRSPDQSTNAHSRIDKNMLDHAICLDTQS